jgi:hypothetical protein
VLHLHAFLKLCEAGDSVFEGHDFTICNERIGLLLMKGRRYLRIFVVQPLPVARK